MFMHIHLTSSDQKVSLPEHVVIQSHSPNNPAFFVLGGAFAVNGNVNPTAEANI